MRNSMPRLVLLFNLQGSVMCAENNSAQTVSRSVCATCHAEQVALWSGSHHDLAMQPASDETVLGDFDNAGLIIL
jgi:cytochrome c551/c552